MISPSIKQLSPLLLALSLVACDNKNTVVKEQPLGNSMPSTTLISGIERSGMDTNTRPQDDFHNFSNGSWLRDTAIPEEYSSYSPFVTLRETAEKNQRAIIQQAAAKKSAKGSDEQKIGDYFASYMDIEAITQLGLAPIRPDLEAIDSTKTKDGLSKLFGHFIRSSINAPIDMGIQQDLKKSDQYTAYIGQSGLGLPNRDYYLEKDNTRFQKVLTAYPGYITQLLTLAGIDDASNKAAAIVQLETKIAEQQWSAIQNRDLDKIYNPSSLADLKKITSAIDWAPLLGDLGIAELEKVIIEQPSYFAGLGQLIEQESLQTWKDYLILRVLSSHAAYLPQPYVDANFDFYGRVIGGKEKQKERWRRGVDVTNGAMGELIGRVYVARHFSPEAKTRMKELVDNLLAEFATGIDNLDWMSDSTKKAAHEKLSTFNVKIGYPDKWRDYSQLQVIEGDLIGNIQNARAFDYAYQLNKIGSPINRDEWHMTPQTVNAYYNPLMNEIVFPAAILQPPFFNMAADDAVNYGAIGLVIGHEISHGFDDQGSKFGGDGNMKNWWTEEDKRRFEERTAQLVAQYDKYSPLEGMFVKGKLTLGENIGDLSGATVALNAYIKSLNGKEAPVIDGYTGVQRFFIGFGQAWRSKYRDEAMTQLVTSNPHSPPRYRVNGVVVNMPAFYQAFDVKEGDEHYLPPEQRVKIW